MTSNTKASSKQKFFSIISIGALALISLSAHAMLFVCRGGGDISLDVDTQDRQDTGEAWITTHYQPYAGSDANVRLDGSHLAPGECSTTYRALRPQEVMPMHHLVSRNALMFNLGTNGYTSYPDAVFAGFWRDPASDGDQNLSYLQGFTDESATGIFDSSRVFYFDLTPSFDALGPNWYVSYVNDHYVRRPPRFRVF